MVRPILALLVALGLAGAAPSGQGAAPPPGWTALRDVYRAGAARHAIVGTSLAVVGADGAILARENVGLRDRTAGLPVTNDTIFHWASITKTFTGIALMQLRDRGLVRLDDPIVKYVPELRKVSNPYGPMDAITIRELLSHSAGFRAATWPWASGADWEPFEPPGWDQLVAMMPYTRIEFPPGSKYSYSNPGLVFIGRVIEDLAGEPYETYVDKQILRPLGMTRTFFDRAPAFLRQDKSHSYFVTDDGTTEGPFDFDTGVTVSNGGLNAPIDDMARYLGFLMGSADPARQARYDTVLSRASLEEMWRPVVPVSDGVDMGLTFFLERHGGMDFIAHSGGQNGFISHFYLRRGWRLAYLVAFNTQTTSTKAGDARNTRALDAAVTGEAVKTIFRVAPGL